VEICKETVEKIAILSKLTFTNEEKGKYTVQPGQILGYVKNLNKVNIEKIRPVSKWPYSEKGRD